MSSSFSSTDKNASAEHVVPRKSYPMFYEKSAEPKQHGCFAAQTLAAWGSKE
jgi:hypothetical protein